MRLIALPLWCWAACAAPLDDSEALPETDGAAPSPDSEGVREADAAPPLSGTRFTVLTMNLRNALLEGDVDQRTQMVADVIAEHAPDFVSLQEVVQTPTMDNRAEVIAAATGYQWTWAVTTGDPLFMEEGPAILSRWPIAWTDVAELPHDDLGGLTTRKAIAAGIQLPDGEITVVASHFTIDESDEVKADQAAATADLIAAHPSPRGATFAGDLNATPDTPAMQLLRDRGFIDAWTAANPDDPGLTFASTAPDRRIDYIYAVPGTDSTPTVTACTLVLTDPVDGVFASDHIGVLCELELR